MTRRMFLGLMVLALVACAEITTPPEAAKDYQGDWTGPGVTLSVRGKRVVYRASGRSLDTPFRGLSGNDIVYGSRGNNRIKVSAAPHRDGAVWKMTADGVELQRPAYDGPPGTHAH